MTANLPNVLLNNGVSIPQLGFGVFQVPPDEAQRTVELALAAGYRHIDTAAAYNNEAGVGAALKASGLPSDEVFVTTKLRNGEQGYESALKAHSASRDRLGVERIDLYLIHWPYPTAGLYLDSWRALEKIYADHEVRAIGVSNFLPEHLDALATHGDVVPAVNQIELHPTLQQHEVAEASRVKGIAVEAYSPLGQGADLGSEPVQEVADALDVTAAQVILRWHLQLGHIVIPKSSTPERIRANLDIAGFELSQDQLDAISALESDNRIGGHPATFSLSQIR